MTLWSGDVRHISVPDPMKLSRNPYPHGERAWSIAALAIPIEWTEQQFRAMGRHDAHDLAVELLAAYQGAAVLTHALRQPELITHEGRRLERSAETPRSEYSSLGVQEPQLHASRQEPSEKEGSCCLVRRDATPGSRGVGTAERSARRTSSPRSSGSARSRWACGHWSRPASTPITSSRRPRTCSVCHTPRRWHSVRSRSG